LAIGALMLFGGENLWGFSLALFIGVSAGTYSSVYIACIMLVWLKLDREDLIPTVSAEAADERP
jgi:preprotein translocase subunit SecF